MIEKCTDLANTATLRDLVATWHEAQAEIREASRLVKSAEARLWHQFRDT